MSTLYLVRHGITPANKENRFAGRTDEELLAEGKEQMLQVGKRLQDRNIQAMYCGPAKRTLQSAEILGSVLKILPSVLNELDEILIPHWDGLTKEGIRNQHGEQYPTWLASPQDFQLPGCETLDQVQKRAARAVNDLLAKAQGQNLLIVSHLVVLRCLVLYFKELPIRDFRKVRIDNGSILQVIKTENGRMSVEYF